MIDESEILRQREIGKQLMVVNILKCENKGSISLISIDDLAKWASYTKEKMRDFYSLCSRFYYYNLCTNAARMYIRCNTDKYDLTKNAFSFVGHTYFHEREYYFNMINDIHNPSREDLYNLNIEERKQAVYNSYCKIYKDQPIENSLNNVDFYKSILQFLINYIRNMTDDALSLGYDWDVIKVLLELNVSYDDYMEFIERLKLSFVI